MGKTPQQVRDAIKKIPPAPTVGIGQRNILGKTGAHEDIFDIFTDRRDMGNFVKHVGKGVADYAHLKKDFDANKVSKEIQELYQLLYHVALATEAFTKVYSDLSLVESDLLDKVSAKLVALEEQAGKGRRQPTAALQDFKESMEFMLERMREWVARARIDQNEIGDRLAKTTIPQLKSIPINK